MTRLPATLVLLLALGCSSEGSDETAKERGRIPDVLAELLLVRDSDEIPPVRFPHARHLDPEFAGKKLDCAYCHHTLDELPGSLPMACGTCHPHEGQDGKAPDI
jgi:hypothetical protein